jgi:uncharacterized membrane protein
MMPRVLPGPGALLPPRLRGEAHFRWRGGEVSRLEALSDAVFAIALTLLVVTLQVPAGAEELATTFWQFPAFALCFAFLIWIWYQHFLFHRRYGFEDALTVALNGALLFCVVFYVYPLKFLAEVLISGRLIGGEATDFGGAGQTVMLLYAGGFTGIFLVLTLMTSRAWRLRAELGLNAAERAATRGTLVAQTGSLALGVASLVLTIALPGHPEFGGLIFFLMGPLWGVIGWRTGVAVARAEGA